MVSPWWQEDLMVTGGPHGARRTPGVQEGPTVSALSPKCQEGPHGDLMVTGGPHGDLTVTGGPHGVSGVPKMTGGSHSVSAVPVVAGGPQCQEGPRGDRRTSW